MVFGPVFADLLPSVKGRGGYAHQFMSVYSLISFFPQPEEKGFEIQHNTLKQGNPLKILGLVSSFHR